eukprot:COSAG02_NODE_923_length_15877_cov_26.660920_8_plen_124_part_00
MGEVVSPSGQERSTRFDPGEVDGDEADVEAGMQDGGGALQQEQVRAPSCAVSPPGCLSLCAVFLSVWPSALLSVSLSGGALQREQVSTVERCLCVWPSLWLSICPSALSLCLCCQLGYGAGVR